MTRFFWLLLVALGLGAKRHWHIFFAIVFGIVLGLLFSGPDYCPIQQFFDVVAQIFIRLITMLVIPLVVSSLIVGISSLGDSRQIGRMGGKVLVFFTMLMGIASIIGFTLALTLTPGNSLRETIEHATATLANGCSLATIHPFDISFTSQVPTDLNSIFTSMIPKNPIESLANADLIPIIVFTILFGVAIACIGEAGKPLVNLFESLFTATMKLTDWVMVLAVPGVFSLAFVTVSAAGPDVFIKLTTYISIVLLGLLIQVFVVFPIILKVFAKVNYLNLYRAISEAMMVAFGTASSSATLPVSIACCERRAGISNRIASFVLPTGATLNKTGTTMFEVIAVLFLIQTYEIPVDPGTQALIMIFAIVASIGAPGVPSVGLITMAIVFNFIGESFDKVSAGIAMLWAIDRALDMCRTVVNVISSATVATIVAASEGELNRDILNNKEAWMEVV
ncbi:MAG: dicarboxylate/amino acid:cation symporter [Cyanobacteria bacterium]|jgi:proton glutamate symport protein|nr:dicarboxylate/amino acid:cation symporter [Cyanobacteriota bacterium]